jgi:hypothetical protein
MVVLGEREWGGVRLMNGRPAMVGIQNDNDAAARRKVVVHLLVHISGTLVRREDPSVPWPDRSHANESASDELVAEVVFRHALEIVRRDESRGVDHGWLSHPHGILASSLRAPSRAECSRAQSGPTGLEARRSQ